MSSSTGFLIYDFDFARVADPNPLPDELAEGPLPEEPEEDESTKFSFSRDLAPYIDQLPAIEADILEMVVLAGKTQAEVGTILGMTQAAVSYRVQRAKNRMRFYAAIPKYTDEELRVGLVEAGLCERHVEVLTIFAATGNQTATAVQIGWTQGRVRHNIMSAIRHLSKIQSAEKWYKMYTLLWANLNLMHQVCLPQWDELKRERLARQQNVMELPRV